MSHSKLELKMNLIVNSAKWVMLVSGLLTATMFYGLFAPQAALESMFGVSFLGELQDIVVRSWSALVGLIGVVLIYGFFNEDVRKFSLIVAAFSKLVFVILILFFGPQFLAKAWPAVTMDVVVIFVALVYLFIPVAESKNA
jgi:hypothetical protein